MMFVLASLLLFASSASHAAEVRIERVAATSQGFPFVEFELTSPFEGIYLEAIDSGLPTTLTYTIELWRQRSGWWDKLEEAYEREFRLFRDLLKDEYNVVTSNDMRSLATLDSLVGDVCVFRRGTHNGPLYFGRELFAPPHQYYVVITASLTPMTVEDLDELDDWVRGTLRGGRDDGGGIAGLSRTMGGLLMSMTGFGDHRVKTRTSNFRFGDLQAVPTPADTTPPTPARLAAPDSSSSR